MSHQIPLMGIVPTLPTDLPAPVGAQLDDKGACLAMLPDGLDIVYSSFEEMAFTQGLDFEAHLDAIGAPDPADYDA